MEGSNEVFGDSFPPLPNMQASVVGSQLGKTQSQNDWRSLLSKQTISSSFSLSYVPPPVTGPISFSEEEVSEGAKEWGQCLVGYAAGRRPSYLALLAAIKRIWKPKGNIDLLTLDQGFFLFKFSCLDDYEHAWTNGPWYILSRPFILKKWTPGLTLSKEDLSTIPIWCNLAKIPLECWNDKGISKISSKIGRPLVVDKLTASRSRINFAKVCVEVSVDSVLPDAIDILVNGVLISVSVSYDWKPSACKACNTFEHPPSSCPANPTPKAGTANAPPLPRGRSRSRIRGVGEIWVEKNPQPPLINSPPIVNSADLTNPAIIPDIQLSNPPAVGKVINLNSSPANSTSNTNPVNPAGSLPPLQFGAHSPTREEVNGGWVTKSSNNTNKKAKPMKEMPPPRHLRSHTNSFKILDPDTVDSEEVSHHSIQN